MKKLLMLGMALAITPSLLMADGNHPMAGCGLGYLLFAKDNNNQGIQILGATVNGTFGSQTFGITSGTSGCTTSGKIAKNKEAEVYAEVNLKNLQAEMAAGGGEYLSGLAGLLGVRESARPGLFKLCQDEYAALFPSSETTSVEMLKALQEKISSRPDLLS